MEYFICQQCRKWTEANHARSRFKVCGSECFIASYGIKDPTKRSNRTIAWLLDAGGDPGFDLNEEATHQPRRLPEPNLFDPSQAIRQPRQEVPFARLSPDVVMAIFQSPLSASAASEQFDVPKDAVYSIRSGKVYSHITGKTAPRKAPPKKRVLIAAETVRAIYSDVGTHEVIAKRHGVTPTNVWGIKSGMYYSSITGHVHSPKRKLKANVVNDEGQ
jgi:hypothetical protein